MSEPLPHEAYDRAVKWAFIMTGAWLCTMVTRNVLACFIANSVSIIAAYAMFREAWNAKPRTLLVCWLFAHSLINLFIGVSLSYANMGLWTEKRGPAVEHLWVQISFEELGGALLFLLSVILLIRAICQWKVPISLN